MHGPGVSYRRVLVIRIVEILLGIEHYKLDLESAILHRMHRPDSKSRVQPCIKVVLSGLLCPWPIGSTDKQHSQLTQNLLRFIQ